MFESKVLLLAAQALAQVMQFRDRRDTTAVARDQAGDCNVVPVLNCSSWLEVGQPVADRGDQDWNRHIVLSRYLIAALRIVSVQTRQPPKAAWPNAMYHADMQPSGRYVGLSTHVLDYIVSTIS